MARLKAVFADWDDLKDVGGIDLIRRSGHLRGHRAAAIRVGQGVRPAQRHSGAFGRPYGANLLRRLAALPERPGPVLVALAGPDRFHQRLALVLGEHDGGDDVALLAADLEDGAVAAAVAQLAGRS